jgi:hypothetical protein
MCSRFSSAACDLEAGACSEILLVADHYVHLFGDFIVHLLRAFLAAVDFSRVMAGRAWNSRNWF